MAYLKKYGPVVLVVAVVLFAYNRFPQVRKILGATA